MKTIESDRLILRAPEPGDFNDFWKLSINWKKTPGPDYDKFPVTEKGCRNFFEYFCRNGNSTRFVYLRGENKIVGLIHLNGFDEYGRMDMGHIIHSKYRNNDIDKEALAMFIDHIFNTTKTRTIVTRNFSGKKQEAPLYSLGFKDDNREQGTLIMGKNNWSGNNKKSKKPGIWQVYPRNIAARRLNPIRLGQES